MSADRVVRPPRAVNALIYDIVTGNGSQLENLDIPEHEWAAMGRSMFGPDYEEHCDVTMRFDDWLELLALAKREALARSLRKD